MDMESEDPQFRTEDFIAFGVILLVSCIIGIYFAYKDRKKSTIDNYFFGGRKMNPIAVGLSMAVTFQSSVGVIATPAEVYITGNLLFWNSLLVAMACIGSILYFIPLFHRLKLRTTFEYLELRFNSKLAKVAAIMRSVTAMFYMGLVVYLPAIALNSVTPLSVYWSIVLTSIICTFYTALGGMKAVIWTDVIQSTMLFVGIIGVFVQGLITIGGFNNLFDAINRGELNTALRFDFGLISRISPLGLILGSFCTNIHALGMSQQIIQRHQSCKTVGHAQCAAVIFLSGHVLIELINVTNGLVMYAYFEGCDPVKSGKIGAIDQALPYMALLLFENVPGFSGLLFAAIFSATLSTVSSGINSFSIVIVEDLIARCSTKVANSERLKLILGKVMVVVLGVVMMLIAFIASLSQSNVVQLLFGFTGTISGPLIGVFLLGFFCPWTNSIGAVIGLLSGLALALLMFIGGEFLKVPYPLQIPPTTVDKCPVITNNFTTVNPLYNEVTEISGDLFMFNETTTPTVPNTGRSSIQDFYNLNYNTYIVWAMLTTILMGLIGSFASGANKPQDLHPKLFIPLIDNECFPLKVRKFFRFGVPEIEKTILKEKEEQCKDDIQDDKL